MYRILPKFAIVAEVGVNRGVNASAIRDNAFPKQLTLIDRWHRPGDEKVMEDVKSKLGYPNVDIRRGTSWEVLEDYPAGHFDWIYLDSDHDENTVKKELEQAKRVVKKAGFICGHDYSIGTSSNNEPFGVIPAVNEFCINNDWGFKFIALCGSGAFSYALQKLS